MLRASWVRLTIAAVLLFGSPAYSQTVTVPLQVTEDTWIDLKNPATYGDGSRLSICPRANYWIYLKFDLSGVAGEITAAELQMKRFSGSRPEEISVYAIEDDSWSESTLSGVNQPNPTAPELGRGFDEVPQGQLARLDAERIVYTEHLIRKEGYAPRQIWRKGEAEAKVVPGRNV